MKTLQFMYSILTDKCLVVSGFVAMTKWCSVGNLVCLLVHTVHILNSYQPMIIYLWVLHLVYKYVAKRTGGHTQYVNLKVLGK